MGFSKKIKEDIFVKSARHCCVCNKSTGLNIEVHHIIPKKQNGEDSFDNAIALCFDCHADAGHYFAGHPKGSKLSPEELIKHKESWFNRVENNQIQEPPKEIIEFIINSKGFNNVFKPSFIKEKTTFINKKSMLRVFELTGEDPIEFVKKRKKENKRNNPFYLPGLNNVETYDEYLNYLSSDRFKSEDELKNTDCQHITFHYGDVRFGEYKEFNLSNCVLDLSIKNTSSRVLEDFKIYLTFSNVLKVDSVNKQREALDMSKYKYNIWFDKKFKGEFKPRQNALVQNDSVKIDSICFRTKHSTKLVVMNWELFARDIHTKGEIKFQINPQFEEENRNKYVETNDVKDPSIRILPKIDFD